MPRTEQDRQAIERDRYALPGTGPTDEDLRHELELTRQELGDTLAGLLSMVDVKARMREKVRRAGATVREHPIVLSGLTAAVVTLFVLWGRQG